MKKLLYSIFALLVLGISFVSCSDDEDESTSLNASQTPEIAAEGIYSGEWLQVLDGDSVWSSGSIIITRTDSAYCADITFSCADFSLTQTSVANITYAGNTASFVFGNPSSDNGLGTSFTGRIDNGSASAMFTLTQKSGRKSYEYDYRFSGTRE